MLETPIHALGFFRKLTFDLHKDICIAVSIARPDAIIGFSCKH
jgi:hypothetical protein